MYLYIPAFASEPGFTGFRGVRRDANMLVPDAQHPPADPDIDRGDPCPEDEEFFDRPDAATMEEGISQSMYAVHTKNVLVHKKYILSIY
jgi:hypothetical protein